MTREESITYLKSMKERFSDLCFDFKGYYDEINKIHKHVYMNYRSIKNIRKKDSINEKISFSEERFRMILKSLVSTQEYSNGIDIPERKVKSFKIGLERRIDRIINSVLRKSTSFVFNYSLKRRARSFIVSHNKLDSRMSEMIKKYENEKLNVKNQNAVKRAEV